MPNDMACLPPTARDLEKSINEDRQFLGSFDPVTDRAAFEEQWRARGSAAKTEVAAFEPNYKGSPIVPGSIGPGGSAVGRHSQFARPGHHLTPLMLASGSNVFELLGPGFTLLVQETAGKPWRTLPRRHARSVFRSPSFRVVAANCDAAMARTWCWSVRITLSPGPVAPRRRSPRRSSGARPGSAEACFSRRLTRLGGSESDRRQPSLRRRASNRRRWKSAVR